MNLYGKILCNNKIDFVLPHADKRCLLGNPLPVTTVLIRSSDRLLPKRAIADR